MKKILFIATGGTIACADTAEGLSPRVSAQSLLDAVPEIGKLCSVDAVQPFSLDSTDLRPSDWAALAGEIHRAYGDYDGFVIAHGTDTMAYGAAALSCLIQRSTKPIVLTGSQKPLTDSDSDAARNLRDAFGVACDETSGVMVVFGGRIIGGQSAVKVHTTDFDAFRSINAPQLGTVSNGVITWHEPHCEDGAPVFFTRLDSSAMLIKLTPAMPPQLLEFAAEHCRALIIECFGMGGIPDYGAAEYESRIGNLAMAGVQVIVTTQVQRGGCGLEVYEVGRRLQKYGVIEAGTMTSEFALMKAMWALAYSADSNDFRELFCREI
ncbi:MAG: asparaginase [Oscillospiraceae bacterium]